MKGYFIPEEQAQMKGLDTDPKYSSLLQKTIITITENDVENFMNDQNLNINLDDSKIHIYQNWFYRNYYDSIIESFVNHCE